MSDLNKLMSIIWINIRIPTLRLLLIIITLSLLTTISLFTIWLTTLTWIYTFDLYQKKAGFKRWIKTASVSLILFLTLATIYYLAGLIGIWAIILTGIILTLGMAAYIIYLNWKVYNAVTTWGAERIRGKHKKDFDLESAMKK